MQLHITTDYAMRILIYLTEKNATIPSSELADKLNIPHNYVQSLGRKMKKLGLVDTVLGPLGGFFLTRNPDEVTLYDVINLMERSVKLNRCLENDRLCSRQATSYCPVHAFLNELQITVEEKLKSVTLTSIVKGSWK